MSPLISTIPSRRPMSLLCILCRGTSFATGLPRFVIRTGSRVSFTSSIRVRQRALNSPADIFFICLLYNIYGHYNMTIKKLTH
jgi:hypothetical protein